MRLLVDMNLSPRWAAVLTGAGFEAAHWSALGSANAPDLEIMAYARTNDYVVLTHDLDFGGILAATGGRSPSVVQIRAKELNPDVLGALVINSLRRMDAELLHGALLTIDIDRMRLRILPLQ